jgi:hypothetical protein
MDKITLQLRKLEKLGFTNKNFKKMVNYFYGINTMVEEPSTY